MKKLLTVLVSVAFLAMAAGAAMAADSNTVTVSASITGTCKFNSATSTLAFGALDPTLTSDATVTGSTTFWCTKGASYTVSGNNGANASGVQKRMVHATLTEYIPYAMSFSPTSGTGAGKTTAVTLSLSGTIANADYINASAGAYTDTVVLSITP